MHDALINLGIAVAVSVGVCVALMVYSAFVVGSRAEENVRRNEAKRRALLLANKQ